MTAGFLENDLKRPHTLVLTLLERLGKKERNVGVGGEAQLLSRFTYEKLSRLPSSSFFTLQRLGFAFRLHGRYERPSVLSETAARLIVSPFFTSTPRAPMNLEARGVYFHPAGDWLNLGPAFRSWQRKLTFTGAVLGNTICGRGEGHVFLLASA